MVEPTTSLKTVQKIGFVQTLIMYEQLFLGDGTTVSKLTEAFYYF